MIECSSPRCPPRGCLQYLTGPTGTVSSFNYRAGCTAQPCTHLQAQRYTVSPPPSDPSPNVISLCSGLCQAGGWLLLHRVEAGHCRHEDIYNVRTNRQNNLGCKYLGLQNPVHFRPDIFRQRTFVKWEPMGLQTEETTY